MLDDTVLEAVRKRAIQYLRRQSRGPRRWLPGGCRAGLRGCEGISLRHHQCTGCLNRLREIAERDAEERRKRRSGKSEANRQST